MKKLAIFSIALVLSFVQGCTSNDRVGAGTEGSINTPAATAAPVGPNAGSTASTSGTSDPAANGGSSLPVAAPYSDGNGPSAQQNVNPAPFLVASQGTGSGGVPPTRAGTLTTRADGTLSGPNDLAAASTGGGTRAASEKPQTARPK